MIPPSITPAKTRPRTFAANLKVGQMANLSSPSLPLMPDWLRRAIDGNKGSGQKGSGSEIADIAATTGAAIAILDTLVRHQTGWHGVWRQRLALAAAVQTARLPGRISDEKELRDAVLLTRPGDDPGPAGRLLLGWQQLAVLPAGELLRPKSLSRLLQNFGYRDDADTIAALVNDIQPLQKVSSTSASLTGAFVISERHNLGVETGAFIADALLAQRLGWEHAVPLLGAENIASGRKRQAQRRPIIDSDDWLDRQDDRLGNEPDGALMMAQARAVRRAIDQSAMLAHPAQRLIAVAPRLRAKAAGTVVELLLSEDAIVASRKIAGISDRGLRRLFDRLIELGAIRELTGRPTFRIYGL